MNIAWQDAVSQLLTPYGGFHYIANVSYVKKKHNITTNSMW